MTTANRSYHHGDLKVALQNEALSQIEASGVDALSLRACARNLSVDAAAAYRHFRTKDELLQSVARVGFSALTEFMQQRVSAKRNSEQQLLASGLAYVEFAQQRPRLFRAMFTIAGQMELAPQPSDANEPTSYAIFSACLERVAMGKVSPQKIERLRTALWGAVHGLADLAVLGLIDGTPKHLEATCRTMIESIVLPNP